MQIKNLKQLFFILIIGLFALQTSTLFCPSHVFVQSSANPNIYINAETGNKYNKMWKTFTDSKGNSVHYTLSEVTFVEGSPQTSSFPIESLDESSFLPPLLQQSSSSPSFLRPPSSPTRPSSSSFPAFPSSDPSSLTSEHLSLLNPHPQQPQQFLRPASEDFHSVDQDLISQPPSRQDSVVSTNSFADPEELDNQYPTVQRLGTSPSGSFSLGRRESFSTSPVAAPTATLTTFSEIPVARAFNTKDITKFLQSSLVLIAQLGSGKLNPEDGDQVAVRSAQSVFDSMSDRAALPFQFYEAGAPNLLGFSYGDAADTNPEKAGIFGHQKSTLLEGSAMHRFFKARCQTLSQEFHDLCNERFAQLKQARDANTNGGVALWNATHKFLTLPSYLVYWAEILEITDEIERLCRREGLPSTSASSSSSSSSDTGTEITIAPGNLAAARANTPTTTVFELATQIAEILFGRGSELNEELTILEKNTQGDGLDTILLVNGVYLPETKAKQSLAEMRWSVHDDFLFRDEDENLSHIKVVSPHFLQVDASMRHQFAEIANQLQKLLLYLTTNPKIDINRLANFRNDIVRPVEEMIAQFFSVHGFGANLAKPILDLSGVSESWRFVISTLIENNSHLDGKSEEALRKYVDFVKDDKKYGMSGPDYKIDEQLETFCENRSKYLNTQAIIPQIANGLPVEITKTNLFALRHQDFRLPANGKPNNGALCLHCGHSPFSLALTIEYLSDETNKLYKVFFEDQRAFGEMDKIAMKLWGDADSLNGELHRRNLLDFVHNPMSFRCAWCRHLERVWSKSDDLDIRSSPTENWETASFRLDNLFAIIKKTSTNRDDYRLEIAGFFVIFPTGCLTFPADPNVALPFQTIGVNHNAIEIEFIDGGKEKPINKAFPGISAQEILEFQLRIARTIQDLFGAWMAMPHDEEQFAMLTPSTKGTEESGLSITFPPGTKFQGDGSIPPDSEEHFGPLPSTFFGSGEDNPFTLTSTRKPPRKASTLPTFPTSPKTSTSPRRQRPTPFDLSITDDPELGSPHPSSPSNSTATSTLTRIPSHNASFVVPEPLGEEPFVEPLEPPPSDFTEHHVLTEEPRDNENPSLINPPSGSLTRTGSTVSPSSKKKRKKKKASEEEPFTSTLKQARKLLAEINQYKEELPPQIQENQSLDSLVRELATLGSNLEQTILAAEKIANDPSDPNPTQATQDLTMAMGQTQAQFDEITKLTSIIQEEAKAAADLASRYERMKTLTPVLSAAQNLASQIRNRAKELETQASQLTDPNQQQQKLVNLTAAQKALEIIDPELTVPITTASSWITDPTQPLSADFVPNFGEAIEKAQQRYTQLLTDLSEKLKQAAELDKAAELAAEAAKKEAKRQQRLANEQGTIGRNQNTATSASFFGSNSPRTSSRPVPSFFAQPQELVKGENEDSSDTSINPRFLDPTLVNVDETRRDDIPEKNPISGFEDESQRKTRKRSRTSPTISDRSITFPDAPSSSTSDFLSSSLPPQAASFEDDNGGRILDPEEEFPLNRHQSLVGTEYETDRISEHQQDPSSSDEPSGFSSSFYNENPQHFQTDDFGASTMTTEDLPEEPFSNPSARPAFPTSASPSDQLTLYPTAVLVGQSSGKPVHPANRNVQVPDKSGPGGAPVHGDGFDRLMDSQVLSRSQMPSESKFKSSPYFDLYGSGYIFSSSQRSEAPVARKQRTLQDIYNTYKEIVDSETYNPIIATDQMITRYQTKIYPLYKEIYEYQSDPNETYTTDKGTLFGKDILFNTINTWLQSAYNNLMRQKLTPSQKELLNNSF